MTGGGSCRALLILERRGPAPRTHSRTGSGCPSPLTRCCRTCCSKVTALGFGRDAMNRVTNHKEGGIADVYDRHRYQEENKKIMETVARHIVTIAEKRSNVIAFI